MVFCSFIRSKAFPVQIDFFQSSFSYLNNHSVAKFCPHHAKLFSYDGPHPSHHSSEFLSLSSGHYGLYFTMFNREADKHSQYRINVLKFEPFFVYIFPKIRTFISQLRLLGFNEQIFETLNEMKTKMRQTMKSRMKSRAARCPATQIVLLSKRAFSTAAKFDRQASTPLTPNVSPLIEDDVDISEDCMEDYKLSQLKKIDDLFANNEYTLIFPIYQSLKRNDIPLASVEMYNKVLKSILYRDLDNSLTLEDIETRLTNLLSVYQDFLSQANKELRPDYETYNLTIGGLLNGSLNAIEYQKTNNLPAALYNDSYVKSQEFALIAFELILSVKDFKKLDLMSLYPKIFAVWDQFPNLVNEELLTLIFDNLIKNSNDFEYYNKLISTAKEFKKVGILKTSEDAYGFILHVYNSYQEKAELFNKKQDYQIYESMIIELIRTGNFDVSTKFLDSILMGFKENYCSEDKEYVSDLISSYITEVSSRNLDEAYKLVKEFNAVSFIPELSMESQNDLINKMVNHYYLLESGRNESNHESVVESQQELYFKIWEIVQYNLIRRDFKLNNSLMSLVIDLNDYDNIYKLSKILLLSDELIDSQIFKKLLTYYYAGLNHNFTAYYDLILSLVEHQSQFYKSHGKLNDYFSDVVDFLVIPGQYPVQALLNSSMIKEVFDRFDLVNDKIYGLIKFSKHLIKSASEVNDDDFLKLLNYQSILINEFENPEMVYFNLDDDLTKFKSDLVEFFKQNEGRINQQSTNMLHTLTILSDEMTPVSSKPVVNIVPRINLRPLLNINYNLGARKFMQYLKLGYAFSDDTLRALINKNFLLTNMSKLNLKSFVKLYLKSEDSSLINDLIGQNFDKINIAVLKNLDVHESKIVDSLLRCLERSSNRYFFEIYQRQNFSLTETQLSKYLHILSKSGKNDEVIRLCEEQPNLLSKEENLVVYLLSLLTLGESSKFANMVKSTFNSKDTVAKLLANENLRTVIDDYYMVSGVEGKLFTPRKYKNAEVLASQIFNQLNNLKNLKALYKLNSKLININQQRIISSLLSKIHDYGLPYTQLLKFCKVSKITKISVRNFQKVIEIMTKLRDEKLLDLLFKKFFNGGITSYLKFDFFEILVTDAKDKLNLLKSFERSFTALNCEINLLKIDNIVVNNNMTPL